MQLLNRDHIDTLAGQLLQIRDQPAHIEQAVLRRPIDAQVKIGFLAVVAAHCRAEYAHV